MYLVVVIFRCIPMVAKMNIILDDVLLEHHSNQ